MCEDRPTMPQGLYVRVGSKIKEHAELCSSPVVRARLSKRQPQTSETKFSTAVSY